MVGGKRLEELSSGGMKTLVNDAYFLAGLTYALRVPSETHLPLLSIIDTPRKNFGSHPDDRRAADASIDGYVAFRIATPRGLSN